MDKNLKESIMQSIIDFVMSHNNPKISDILQYQGLPNKKNAKLISTVFGMLARELILIDDYGNFTINILTSEQPTEIENNILIFIHKHQTNNNINIGTILKSLNVEVDYNTLVLTQIVIEMLIIKKLTLLSDSCFHIVEIDKINIGTSEQEQIIYDYVCGHQKNEKIFFVDFFHIKDLKTKCDIFYVVQKLIHNNKLIITDDGCFRAVEFIEPKNEIDAYEFIEKKETLKSEELTFEKELEILINKHSMENNSDTPDFILSEYIQDSLDAFNKATNRRDKYYHEPEILHN